MTKYVLHTHCERSMYETDIRLHRSMCLSFTSVWITTQDVSCSYFCVWDVDFNHSCQSNCFFNPIGCQTLPVEHNIVTVYQSLRRFNTVESPAVSQSKRPFLWGIMNVTIGSQKLVAWSQTSTLAPPRRLFSSVSCYPIQYTVIWHIINVIRRVDRKIFIF